MNQKKKTRNRSEKDRFMMLAKKMYDYIFSCNKARPK